VERGQGTPDTLTRREREVTALVAQGLMNRQIAAQLSIAEKTIEMHVSNCLGKLGFATRAQLAAWAVSEGITPSPASQ
jgi:non-specific serine/threonine protein kinase